MDLTLARHFAAPTEMLWRIGITFPRWVTVAGGLTLSDGGVEMRLAVASTLELVPWVLGWGDACEVIAPAELREHVARHLRDGAALYAATRGVAHDPRLVL